MIKRILIGLLLLASLTAYPQTNNFKWLIEQPWTTSGTDTYTTTIPGFPAAYATGMVIKIKFANANTGSSTLNINSLGAKTLKKSGATNLASGDLSAGQEFELSYDGTNFQVFGIGGSGGGGGTTETASNGLTKVVNDIQLGGSFTGTVTLAAGTNPFILTSSVSTGTGATAGIQNVFNSLTTGNGLDISSSSYSSGAIVKITGTGTAAASNTQSGLVVDVSGANATSTQTTYGGYFNNTKTGTSSTNIAGYFNASGGTNNLAIYAPSGIVTLGSTGAGYNGRLYSTAGTGGRVAILGNLEITTSAGPSLLGTGIQAVGINRKISFYGGNWSTDNDLVDAGWGATSVNRSGVDLGILKSSLGAFSAAIFQANSIAAFRFIDTWPTLTTPMTTVYGFDYNPGGAGNATNHIAIRTTSGSIFFANASGNTPTASTRLDVRGIGTTTNKTFRTASSTNTQTFEILDNANINALPISGSIMTLGGGATASELRFLEPSGSGANYTAFKAVAQGADITYSLPPTVGAAGSKLTDVAGNGVLTWVAGGAGISNTAASNEMMKSDGTNAVPSGLFSTTSGSLDMGTGVAGSERILRAYSSGSDAGITTFMKGVGKFLITGDIAENATISLEYNPSVSDIKYVKIAGANVSGTVGIHSAHGTVTNGSAMDFEILGGNAFAASGLDGGDLNFNPGNKDGAGIDGNIGLLVTTPNFQSGGKIIFVGNNTATPTAAPASGFFHYSNSGVPTWRTSTNNIIFLEKQSAVTTPQGIADALTTLGLLNSSTISGGSGLTYAQTKAIAMKIK